MFRLIPNHVSRAPLPITRHLLPVLMPDNVFSLDQENLMSDNAPGSPDNSHKPASLDLDAMTIQQLTALRDEVEAKRREKLEAAKQAVLSETRAKLAELGLTLEAALPSAGAPGAAGRPRKPVSVPVKYQGPDGEKWSGRGRLPKWVEDQEKQGKSRDDFLAQKGG